MDEKLELQVEESNPNTNSQLIKLTGEIDRETINIFRDTIDEVLKTFQNDYLILDFTNVSFLNSEGIGFLTDLQNKFSRDNKKLFLVGASERVMDIFYLVGLNQIIKCYGSLDECLVDLQK